MRDNPITRRNFLLGNTKSVSSKVKSLPFLDESGFTPNANFYRPVSRHIPQITSVYWMLRLQGMIDRPITISYDDLLAMPSVEQAYTLISPAGNSRNPMIGDAQWTGVPMSDLLSNLNLSPQTAYAQLYAADGYTTFLHVDELKTALLAYKINGEMLPAEQGFPARLIVPGRYDYKMPRWIQRIEFTDSPQPGFWETSGWAMDGTVTPTAYLLTPHHMETVSNVISLTGVAYAGERPVTGVEVSIDDAPWMPVSTSLSEPYRWATWQIDWQPAIAGDYLIRVRVAEDNSLSSMNEHSRGTVIHVTGLQ